MRDLLSLFGLITVTFYFVMLLSPAFAAGKLKTPHASWIFWTGLLAGTMCLGFVSYLKMPVVFFAWVGLMVWAGIDVQIGQAKRMDSLPVRPRCIADAGASSRTLSSQRSFWTKVRIHRTV
jgi:hypothetical protein